MTPSLTDKSPPDYLPIHLDNFNPSWVGAHPSNLGFTFGSDEGILVCTDEQGKETSDRLAVSPSQEAINGFAAIRNCLAVSTGQEMTVLVNPTEANEKVRSTVIPQGTHGVVATSSGRFFSPAGHDGLMVIDPSFESNADHRLNVFPGSPLNIYQLYDMPALHGTTYLLAACRSRGVGLIDVSPATPEIGLKIGALEAADIVDASYLGNAAYPYAIAAVGIRGELLLCRNIVRQEPPITLNYTNFAGRVYRILCGHGHLFVLTSKAVYVLADLAALGSTRLR